MDRCVLCGDKIEPHEFEAPEGGAVISVNPVSFHRAKMHVHCAMVAEETAQEMPSSSIMYDSRYDEYIEKYVR